MSHLLPGVGRIPLRARDGSVRAYATVDLADYARINEHRWYLSGGYAVRQVWIPHLKAQRVLSMHRAVMGLYYGDPVEVDHIKPDQKLNNTRANLRIVTTAQNAQNRLPFSGKSSRYRGVSYDRTHNRWKAQAFCGDKKFRATFRREEDARDAVMAWRREHMPFAND